MTITDSRTPGSAAMGILFQKVMALVFAAFCIAILIDYPFARIPLAAMLAIYLVFLIQRPGSWLFVVPMALPVLQLGPWSGRLFVDEFDALILLTVAATLWQGRYANPFRQMHGTQKAALFALVVAYTFSLFRSTSFNWPLDPNATANYYSTLNGLRVTKGFFWALLLAPAWAFETRLAGDKAKRNFVRGLAGGSIVVVLIVLWERGVFQALVNWTGIDAPIEALLDFGTSYRVTAMFADMHTGGTAIDGYIAIVLPIVVASLVSIKDRISAAAYGMAAIGILYVATVTFSRGVYLGLGTALIAAAWIFARSSAYKLPPKSIASLMLAVTLVSLAAFIGFRTGGIASMVYALLMFLGAAFAAANRRQTAKRTIVIGFALAVATMVALATSSIATRHYTLEQVPALAIAMLVIAVAAMAGLIFVRSLGERLEGRKVLLLLFGTTIICALVIPTLFGTRMEARFDTIKQDLAGRLAHWQTAVEIMDDDWMTTLAGQGVGRFPERYFWIHQNAADVGGFRFDAENRNNFIRFHGAHDVRLGQRTALEPRSKYRIALDVRTEDPRALLYLRICHRQLIEASEWNPTCVQFKETIETTEGRWVHRSFDFDSGDLGSWKNLLRAPLVVTFSNRREYAFNLRPQTVLDIDNITLTGLDGLQLLDNGDFESGIDRWFAYYDFNHLPWHIKNLWVHIFFEIGLVGLLLFLGLIFGAMLRAFRAARSDIFAGALFVSLCSFTTVGTFGTLVDAPRIGFLFFFVLLIASGLNLDSHRGQKTA